MKTAIIVLAVLLVASVILNIAGLGLCSCRQKPAVVEDEAEMAEASAKDLRLAETLQRQNMAELSFIRKTALVEEASKTVAVVDKLLEKAEQRFRSMVEGMEHKVLRLPAKPGYIEREDRRKKMEEMLARRQAESEKKKASDIKSTAPE